MGVKVIVSTDDLRQRMGLQDISEINDALDSALTAAHTVFQGLLETQFEPRQGLQDVFHLDRDAFPVVKNSLFRLRLKQAFVKVGSVSVKVSNNKFDFTQGETLSSGSDFAIDFTKGVVYVSEEFAGKFAQVTYDAGFDATNKAPFWLVEAVMAYVPNVLNSQQTTNRSSEAEPAAKENAKIAIPMVEPYMRGKALQLKPIF